MEDALAWLLKHYKSAKLWMGLEAEGGVELFLTCFPSRKEAVVNLLKVYEDDLSIFESSTSSAAVGESLVVGLSLMVRSVKRFPL
ncbi:MAG: hypothetical protein ABF322_05700 [Lentimonas sp.]